MFQLCLALVCLNVASADTSSVSNICKNKRTKVIRVRKGPCKPSESIVKYRRDTLTFSQATPDISTTNADNFEIVPGEGGKVGIGTTAPTAFFDVLWSTADENADRSVAASIVASDAGAVSSGDDVLTGLSIDTSRFGAISGNTSATGVAIQVSGDTGGNSVATGLTVDVAGADANYAAIFTGGNVGIGVAAPDEQLHLSGRIHLGPDSTPVDTADRLYNVGGKLFWNGIDLTEEAENDGSGYITAVTAGTGLTGGGTTGAVTLNVDVGTVANKILQLNGSAEIPAVSAANVTNLNASQLVTGTIPDARMSSNVSLLGSSINLDTEVTGTLPVSSGGTGVSSLSDFVTLGSHTTGNYVASVATSTGLTGGSSGSEGASLSLSIDQAFSPTWTAAHSFSNTVTMAGDVAIGNAVTDNVTITGALQGAVPLILDGATDDTTELSLAVAALSADRTITFPDATGTVALVGSGSSGYLLDTGDTGTGDYVFSGTLDLNSAVLQGQDALIFEGSSADANETTLRVANPSGDNLIVLPNASGTVAVSATSPVSLSAAGAISLSQNAGTDITADLEEETHATEHSAGGADPITVTNLASACGDAQVLGGTAGGTGVECQADDDTPDDDTEVPNDITLATTGKTHTFTLGAGDYVRVDAQTTPSTVATGILDLRGQSSQNSFKTAGINTVITGTGAITSYGLYNDWESSAVVTGTGVNQTAYGIYNEVEKSGADTTTGEYLLVGQKVVATNTGSTDTGGRYTYAGQFSAFGDSAGSSTAVGIFASASGADSNYAGIFSEGNVGIGDVTPSALLTVGDGDKFRVDASGNVTLSDSTMLDLSGINMSANTEGFRIPQATACTNSTLDGQLCWDTDNDKLYIGDGSSATEIGAGGGGSGDVESVGNCSSGACFTGASGSSLTSTTGETLDLGTANTLIFQRDGSGAVAFTGKDNGANTDTIYDTTGAGTITVGSADVTSVTVTTDGTGTGEVVLPNDSIGVAEFAQGTSGQILMSNTTPDTAWVTMSGDVTIDGSGVTTIQSNAITLGTDTGGNYVATIAASGPVSVSGSGSETAAVTVGITADGIDFDSIADSLTLDAATSISGASGVTLTESFTIGADTSQTGSHNIDLTNGINTTGTRNQSALDIDLTNANHSGGTTNLYGIDLQVTDNDAASTSNVYGINIGDGFDFAINAVGASRFTVAGNEGISIDATDDRAATIPGLYVDVDLGGDASSGIAVTAESTSTATSGVTTVFGTAVFPTQSGNGSGGQHTLVGFGVGPVSTTGSLDGAQHQTGLYVGNQGAANTELSYGFYVAAQSGSTASYGAYIASNLGVGDATPQSLLTVGDGDKFQVDSSGNVVLADGVLLNLSGIDGSSATEGIRLPQASSCVASVAEGQVCWDSDNDALYIGDGLAANEIGAGGGGGSGDVTSIGNCSTGDCFGGATGTTLTSTTGEIIDLGTANTFIFQRNDSGAIAFTGKDDAGAADTIYDTTGAGTVTVGSADVTSVTVTTDGTGTGEVVLPNDAIGVAEFAQGTSGQILMSNTTPDTAWVTMSGDVTIDGSGATSIQSNAIALGTDTTGNYVATIAASGPVSVSGSGSESAAITVGITADAIDFDSIADSMTLDAATTISSSATTTDPLTITAGSLTTGTALTIAGPSGGTAGVTDSVMKVSGNVGDLGASAGLQSLTAVVNSSAGGANAANLYLDTTNNNTTNSNAIAGLSSKLTDAVNLGNTDIGAAISVDVTGDVNDTKTAYGIMAAVSNDNTGTDQGTRYTTGGYFAASGSSRGASTAIGLQAAASGADNNYALITSGGNVGIGDSSPTALFTVGSGELFTVDSSGQMYAKGNSAIGEAPDGASGISSVAGLNAKPVFDSDADCTYGCHGVVGKAYANNPTNANLAIGVTGQYEAANASFTLSNGVGFFAANGIKGGGATVSHGYGVFVQDQTAATNDYGIAIEGADTAALWVSSAADNTDAANGISFGQSRDTNLYRSAANTLKTDDALTLGGQLTTASSGVEFTESDSNPSCAAGNFSIYADLSENKLKKCENGSASDLDTTAGGGGATLGTDTSGNYVATIAASGPISVSGSGSETAAVTVGVTADAIDYESISDSLTLDAATSMSASSGRTYTQSYTVSADTSQQGSLNIDFTNGINTTGTVNQTAVDIDLTNANHSGGTTNLYGIDLQITDNDANTTSNTVGLNIGSGFDYAIQTNGDSIFYGQTQTIPTFDSGDSCVFGCYATISKAFVDNPTSPNAATGLVGWVETADASFTLASATALTAFNAVKGAASTITNNYGVRVLDQTAGTNDFGIAIDGADTAALWISAGADNTDAANGIMFGNSRDTNLYRSAANVLKTDDSLSVGGSSITLSGATSCSGTTEGQICWDTDNDHLRVGSGSAALPVGSIFIIGANPTGRNDTHYIGIGGIGSSTSESAVRVYAPPMSLKVNTVSASVVTAPGGSGSWSVQLFKNGSGTGATCSITGSNTTCVADLSASPVSITSTDFITVGLTETGSATGTAGGSVTVVAYPG